MQNIIIKQISPCLRASVFYLLLFSSLSLSAQTQATLQKVDAYLSSYMDSVPMPGLSVAIVKGDQIIFQKGYGVERLGEAKTMSPQSMLGIGELTMSMTAVAILQLVEKGQLSLDDKVIKYLPWFKTANKEFSDQITIRMLINHTSGIPPQFESIPSLEDATALEDFVRSMDAYFISKTPGLSYEASREAFCIAGLIINKVSGQSFSSYMEKNIFQALGMKRTTTNPEKIAQLGALYGHEVGLTECIPAEKSLFESNYLPAGTEMRSTAEDIGKYLGALLNKGTYKGKQILRPESVAQIWTPQISFEGQGTMIGGNGLDIEYGFGWLKMIIDDRPLYLHPGNTGTMSSITGINLEKGFAMVVLFNADSGRFNRFVFPTIENVGNNIMHLLADEPITDFARPRIEDPFDEYYDLQKADWDKYIGEYVSIGDAHPVYKDYTIKVFVGESDSLELQGYKEDIQKGHFKLQFSSKSRAVLRSIVQPREIQFKVNPNGAVTGVFIYGSEFKKKEADRVEQYQTIVKEASEMSFVLPKDWQGQWTNSQYMATSPKHKDTKMTFEIQSIGATNFETFSVQQLAQYTIANKGIPKKEVVKDGVWTEQSFFTKDNNQIQQHLLVLYQDPIAKKQVQFVLTNPWGGFNNELQDMVKQFQQSLIF